MPEEKYGLGFATFGATRGGAMYGAAAAGFLVAILVVGSIGAGCSREHASDLPNLPDRHARQFSPFVAPDDDDFEFFSARL